MHHLVVENALAESLALAGVGDGLVDQPIQTAQRTRRRIQPLFLELHHLQREAAAFFADQVAPRHAHVVEVELRGVARMHAYLGYLLFADALGVHRHDDQALVLVPRGITGVGAGIDQKAAPVGLQPVRDPHLAAVDEVVTTVNLGVGLDGRDVRAATGLADAEAGDVVAGDRRHQVFAAQLVAAKACQCRCRHVGLHADGHRHTAAVALAQSLGHHHRVAEVQAHAAKLFGVFQSQQSQLAELLENLVRRELPFRFPFGNKGVDLLVAELDDRVFDLAVFSGELQFNLLN